MTQAFRQVRCHGRNADTDDTSIPDIKAAKSSGEKTPKKKVSPSKPGQFQPLNTTRSDGCGQHEDMDSSECGEESEPE